jgi:hypothetical protein
VVMPEVTSCLKVSFYKKIVIKFFYNNFNFNQFPRDLNFKRIEFQNIGFSIGYLNMRKIIVLDSKKGKKYKNFKIKIKLKTKQRG